MSSDDLIEVIRQRFSSGICFSPTTVLMLENILGQSITEEMIGDVKKSMFTNDDGISFLLDSIAENSVRTQIAFEIMVFVDEFGKYEPEAFYKKYKGSVDTSIIRSPEDFQTFLTILLPKPYPSKTLIRMRDGPSLCKIITKIENIVIDNDGGIIPFNVLMDDIPGFTESKVKSMIATSHKLVQVDSPSGPLVESIDMFGLPDDLIDNVNEIKDKLTSFGIELKNEIMNPILSLHYGYNFFEEHNLTSDSFRKIIETFELEKADE